MTYARVAFTNNATGARLEGEFIADTGPTWMVKPSGKPVVVLQKVEWTSVAVPTDSLENLMDLLSGKGFQ